jgi:hypothetical protein
MQHFLVELQLHSMWAQPSFVPFINTAECLRIATFLKLKRQNQLHSKQSNLVWHGLTLTLHNHLKNTT